MKKKPINNILTNQTKAPIFLDRKVKLKPHQAVIATFMMRNQMSLETTDRCVWFQFPTVKAQLF